MWCWHLLRYISFKNRVRSANHNYFSQYRIIDQTVIRRMDWCDDIKMGIGLDMNRKYLSEFVLLLILINYILFLKVGFSVWSELTIVMRIILGVVDIYIMIVSYLLNFFFWTGEDKTVYVVEKNNRSYLCTWFVILSCYTIISMVWYSNRKVITTGTLLLLIGYIFFRVFFMFKDEINFLENKKLIEEYSQNIIFLLFSYGLGTSVFTFFSVDTPLFLFFIIFNTLSYLTICSIYIKVYRGRLKSCVGYIYFLELIVGVVGIYILKINNLISCCIILLILTVLIFVLGICRYTCEVNSTLE